MYLGQDRTVFKRYFGQDGTYFFRYLGRDGTVFMTEEVSVYQEFCIVPSRSSYLIKSVPLRLRYLIKLFRPSQETL